MFFYLETVEEFFILVVIILASALLLKVLWHRGIWLRGIALVAAVPVGLVALLFLALSLHEQLTSEANAHGAPIYSPDGKSAALISTADFGATGGDTTVTVYSAHGLRFKDVLYIDDWKAVDQSDVTWNDDHHLFIRYMHLPEHEPPRCQDFGNTKVVYEAK